MHVTSTNVRRPLAFLGLCLALIVATAYLASAGSSAAQAKKVVYLGCDEANPFCASYNKTMQTALQQAGFSVSALYNNFDPSVQAQQMSQATAQKPDAIVVFVADSTAIVPSLARASAAGIPVMVVGTAVPDSALKYVTLMNLQDSTQLGTFAAQNLVEGMKKQGLTKGNVIALTGTSSQIDVQQRVAAFKSYLAKIPQFKLVAVQNANWDAVQSASLREGAVRQVRVAGRRSRASTAWPTTWRSVRSTQRRAPGSRSACRTGSSSPAATARPPA